MIRKTLWVVLALLVIPSIAGGAWSLVEVWPHSFRDANWASSGIGPDPRKEREAIVQVYAARAGRWKGVFGVHTWIVMKPADSSRFQRYDVVGWGKPVRHNLHPVDGNWYSHTPKIIRDVRGPLAARLIPQIRKAIARYPKNRRGDYQVWPGPNSNSFIAWVARQVPELQLEMPPTAVGKDFMGSGLEVGPTPSGTGWQFSAFGVFGAALSRKEGVELHVLGATLGIDFDDVAIKLPSLGKISLLPW